MLTNLLYEGNLNVISRADVVIASTCFLPDETGKVRIFTGGIQNGIPGQKELVHTIRAGEGDYLPCAKDKHLILKKEI